MIFRYNPPHFDNYHVDCQLKTTKTIAFALLASFSASAVAKFDLTPSITASATYTDNVFTTSGTRKESDTISEIAPQIHAVGQGGRNTLNLTYRAQNLFYANNSQLDNTRHQIEATNNTEVIDDFLFFKIGASQFQRATFLQGQQIDSFDLAPSPTTTDVLTYRLNPYIQQRLGNTAKLRLSYQYSQTHYDQTLANAGDSDNAITELNLANGPRFQRWTWNLKYSHKEENNDNPLLTDTTLERALLDNRYKIMPKVNLIAIVGYEDNHYSARIDRTKKGEEWRVGAQWAPSQHTNLEATAGQRYYGDTMSLSLTHAANKANYSLRYEEEVTTTNFTQSQTLAFDEDGNPYYTYTSPTTESNLLLSKNVTGQALFKLRRSVVTLKLTSSQREDLQNLRDEDALNASVDYAVQLGRRNQASMKVNWVERDFSSQSRTDKRSESTLGFRRQLGRHVSADAKYSYADQSSTNDAYTFRRNLFYVGLTMKMP